MISILSYEKTEDNTNILFASRDKREQFLTDMLVTLVILERKGYGTPKEIKRLRRMLFRMSSDMDRVETMFKDLARHAPSEEGPAEKKDRKKKKGGRKKKDKKADVPAAEPETTVETITPPAPVIEN